MKEKVFSEDGKLEEERVYKNNLIDGEEVYYYENGKVAEKGQYVAGKRNGLSVDYY